MSKQRIVIVGGGFGGTKAALELCDNEAFDLTLISDHPDLRYYPALYHTAAGGRRDLSSLPFTDLFDGKKLSFVQGKIVGLDRQAKTITLEDKRVVSYDKLILSLGVVTNYFGVKGLQEYSYGIKSNTEAEELKKHLHKQVIDDKHLDLNYVVIGGGPTGVEMAGGLVHYIRQIAKNHKLKHPAIHIDLIEAAPRLLPRMPKDVSAAVRSRLRRIGVKVMLNTAVKAETADGLMINNKRLSSHTVIWTAGVTNHPFLSTQNFQETKSGRVRVNQFMEAEPDIYVLGDNADTPYSGMAQTALLDGDFVAKNLIRQSNGKDPKTYTAKKPIYVIPVGNYWSAVLWGQLRIYGWLGWALRRLGDLVGYHDYEPWTRAGKRWMDEGEHEELCSICG